MIARIWKGAVRKQDGDAYADYMQKTGIAGYASTSGNRGVWMLRRDRDSLDSVKAFRRPGLRDRRLLPRRRPLPRRARPVLNALLRPDAQRTARQRRGRRHRPRVRDMAAFNTHKPRPSLGLPQRRHAMGHRKRSLPRHRRTREALRRRIHGLEPQLTIKNMVIDGTEVACELSEHLVEGATRVDHIAGSFLSVAAWCASR